MAESGVNRMRTWSIMPCYHCAGWWCNGVEGCFLGTL